MKEKELIEKQERINELWNILESDLDEPFWAMITELVELEHELESECNK